MAEKGMTASGYGTEYAWQIQCRNNKYYYHCILVMHVCLLT